MKALAIFGSFRTAAAGLAGAFVFTVFRFHLAGIPRIVDCY
jgi:conjugal transfer mating pair stabilization protein TraG